MVGSSLNRQMRGFENACMLGTLQGQSSLISEFLEFCMLVMLAKGP
jgi:hypothetical protein